MNSLKVLVEVAFVFLLSEMMLVGTNFVGQKEKHYPSHMEKTCQPNDEKGCSCAFSDGSGTVDLTSLGNTDGTPRFHDVEQEDGSQKYSYNPCNGFIEGKCENAALCLTTDPSNTMQIGDAGKTLYAYNPETDSVVAGYSAHSSVLMTGEVELKCDMSACDPVLVPHGSVVIGSYKFTLTSVCACAGGCNEKGPVNKCTSNSAAESSFSIGTAVLIVLGGLALCYVVFGVTYRKLRHKASGSDIIPNKEFWINFPGRLKSGFIFTFQKCLPQKYRYSDI